MSTPTPLTETAFEPNRQFQFSVLTCAGVEYIVETSTDLLVWVYGIAPVIKQSGNMCVVHMRTRCPKFGRQTFHENASRAITQEPWARSCYEEYKKRHEGKHHPACRNLAFKLIRIYFACWRDRTTYEAARYAAALEKHGSPLPRLVKISKSQPATAGE